MTTPKIQGLRSLREEMKAVARGERPAPPDAARVSFDCVEALTRRPRAQSSEPGRYAMARHQTLKRSLTWGDTVKVSEGVPARFRPGDLGAVCGVRAIETAAVAAEFNQPLGTTLYLVEFADGEAIEVPEAFLSAA